MKPIASDTLEQWYIAWNREKHTLSWRYGKLDGLVHPVEVRGMNHYTRRNFCLVFPRISKREWKHLWDGVRFRHTVKWGSCVSSMAGREIVPTGLEKFEREFYNTVTEDVFGRRKNVKANPG